MLMRTFIAVRSFSFRSDRVESLVNLSWLSGLLDVVEPAVDVRCSVVPLELLLDAYSFQVLRGIDHVFEGCASCIAWKRNFTVTFEAFLIALLVWSVYVPHLA